ncbi:hypothetical protein CVT25_002125 [Psilocybe cyanescens]|uniref:Uncharacterized protein n=1 Tax=Psilocybe cyanescens TaxID=93625 RepID=A0A409XC59_PSICY|nr:hypothetical protein CVT25_002125 [Psilocybe cyanescens]
MFVFIWRGKREDRDAGRQEECEAEAQTRKERENTKRNQDRPVQPRREGKWQITGNAKQEEKKTETGTRISSHERFHKKSHN